jgi:hypothetical protein
MVTPDLLDDDDRARSRVAEHRDALVLLHVNVGVEDAEEALPQP